MNIEFEDGSTDYMCECTESYKGINCSKLKDCLSEPCQNGGTCTVRKSVVMTVLASRQKWFSSSN